MTLTSNSIDNTSTLTSPTVGAQHSVEAKKGVFPEPHSQSEESSDTCIAFSTVSVPGVGVRSVFTHLRVLNPLREGTAGRVFLTKDSSTFDVFVALKIFNKQDLLEGGGLGNTLMGRRCLADTRDNAFTLGLQASFQDETRLYMLMDYCAGGDMEMEISRWSRGMPIDTAVYNAAHLLEGIASLHASGIIHRDLKPENILLTIHGHVKISGFDLATCVSLPEQWIEPTFTDDFGTAAYHAPEVIAGYPYNCAIDWWCLGIIIYEMLVGEHPFLPEPVDDEGTKVDIEDLQESICNGEYTLPKSLDSSARRIIRGFLRVDPERRYGAAEARSLAFFDGWNWDLVRALKYQSPTPRAAAVRDVVPDTVPDFVDTCFGDGNDGSSSDTDDPSLFEGFEPISALCYEELAASEFPMAVNFLAASSDPQYYTADVTPYSSRSTQQCDCPPTLRRSLSLY